MASDNTFDPVVGRWLGHLGSVRDLVRQELVTRQLAAHLPHQERRVLDVGCGQGTQAIRLAKLGHQVTGVDPSAELLDHARASTEQEPPDVQERLTWRQGGLFELHDDQEWDVVCCHGVLMYLPDLHSATAALVSLARPHGLLSILTRNQAGISMRAGMTRQWQQALDGFDATRYTNRLGADARADSPDEVRAALEGAGARLEEWYGVRLFTDHWEKQLPSEDLDLLVTAEAEAGRRDPNRQVAALTHTLATRLP
jgi:2-polyprenyl-3-methyl-5-hydroxy-6-metoxy-1,4-benzoquinol methylase